MRFAIFGDIHANLEAFEAVLADAEEEGCDRNICLGDIVGYNADPKACLDKVRELKCPIVKGSHDDYASTLNSLDNFNPLAESAIRWTRDKLSEADKAFLRDLPLITDVESFTIVHATLDGPGEWGYVLNQLDAAASFSKQKAQVCFFGHTHAPRLYIRDGSVVGLPLEEVVIEPQRKYFINVGSVGQPRDGDWRAAYAIFDFDEKIVRLRRVRYDIASTKLKIVNAGLPAKLAERLFHGR
jgi:predicted phosphodiesterase